jgi:hypothetical protein
MGLTKPFNGKTKGQQKEFYFGKDELEKIYDDQISPYEEKEFQLVRASEKALPEELTERQRKKDDAIIERIAQERLNAQMQFEAEKNYVMATKEDEEYWLRKFSIGKGISLEEAYKTKREYPEEFIRLMQKQPLEGRLALLNCFDCISEYRTGRKIEKCKFEKAAKGNVTNGYALELIGACYVYKTLHR